MEINMWEVGICSLRTFFFHKFFTGSWNGCLLLNWTFSVQPRIITESFPRSSWGAPEKTCTGCTCGQSGACQWGPGCLAPLGWLLVSRFGSVNVAHGFAHLSFALHRSELLTSPQHSISAMLRCLTVQSLLLVVLIKTEGQMLFWRLLIICFIYCWYGNQRNLWSITSCSSHCCISV